VPDRAKGRGGGVFSVSQRGGEKKLRPLQRKPNTEASVEGHCLGFA
jgi:hypothetical protein